ncbi:MAG: DUF2202 domain-containing protein [Saprospiraceae bacterium]|nr:DUF2202 domain-containing protein [Saprospiraceae bacterium]
MNKLIYTGVIALLALISCTKDDQIVSKLTDQEKLDLIFLRQEEKLAHDVYVYAFKKYGITIFNNISNSEQTHITNMTDLLTKYKIVDPASGLQEGEFADFQLQTLYYQLITKVNISLKDALEAGATIEDLDISDIQSFYKNTTKADIIQVYELLTCGSRNHLRGFTGQLKTLGSSYTPQFLTDGEYQTILSGSHEHCGK